MSEYSIQQLSNKFAFSQKWEMFPSCFFSKVGNTIPKVWNSPVISGNGKQRVGGRWRHNGPQGGNQTPQKESALNKTDQNFVTITNYDIYIYIYILFIRKGGLEHSLAGGGADRTSRGSTSRSRTSRRTRTCPARRRSRPQTYKTVIGGIIYCRDFTRHQFHKASIFLIRMDFDETKATRILSSGRVYLCILCRISDYTQQRYERFLVKMLMQSRHRFDKRTRTSRQWIPDFVRLRSSLIQP